MSEQAPTMEQLSPKDRAMALKYLARNWDAAIARLDIRKRAIELAVAAVGPQSPDTKEWETTRKINHVADNLVAFMLKEQPQFSVEEKRP